MLDRTVAPAFQKTISLSLPDPVTIGDSAYAPVFYLTGLRQNIIKIEVIFNAGKWVEPKIGLSHFTAMMLEKGTTSKTSVAIAETLDRYGASLEISPGFDVVSVSLYSLTSKLRDIFPLFIELMTVPNFQERELAMMLDIFRQNLKVNNEKTSFLASKKIRSTVFGENHPYGTTVEAADTHALTPDDLSEFFKKSFVIDSTFVLGDLDPGTLDYVCRGLQSLPQRTAAPRSAPIRNAGSTSVDIVKEGRTQATIRLGKKGILRSHPDYAELLFATHLLGGFFGSRLMKNIREEKGLTYGISASLNAFKNDSLLMIGADVNRENVSVALSEIRKELYHLTMEPVTEEELDLAKNHFTGSLQTDMANLFSVEEKIKAIHLNGLPVGFYQDLLFRIDAVTPETLRMIAARYFDEHTFAEVVVQ